MEFSTFDSIKIGLASPEQIRNWSYGAVERPETINYRTQKPERDGLFCERIFGPTKDWECHCGKFKKIRFKGKVCDRCGVEVTRAKVRRERMGHIELAAPVSHIWYFKGTPSRIGQVLEVSQKRLEEVLYFTKYIVLDPGGTDLVKKQLLSEKEYLSYQEKYGDDFKAEMGAEAIYKLLQEFDPARYDVMKNKLVMSGKLTLDKTQREACKNCEFAHNCKECAFCQDVDAEWRNNLEVASDELKEELQGLPAGQKKIKLLKRLEIIEAFRLSGNKPEWMVMTVVPVIPPELRPMVMLDGGRYATSDLNDLYRRVINRNNRLKRMLTLEAPDIIIRNEKRMLQEAVDALIDNGRHGRPVTGPNNRALKSLSDMLKGKQGRFRQNLLGKRVDYSGRSVIVVGPELKMYQCGLPKEMALELFKPFVLKRLVDTKVIANIKSARKMVDRASTEVWDALENVIKDHPVLLNRAPTLHRLGIQAFEPVLVEGRALKLHPLVCTAYNADFDGDQMAVHLPLSAEAQAEARFLMLAANNLLKPSDGCPVAVPTQDMVLGSYYLTMLKQGEPGEGKVFRDQDEALMAYYEHDVSLHAAIKVRVTKDIGERKVSKIIDCTVGRLIFNENIPQNLGYVDRTNSDKQFDLEISFLVGKKQLSDIIERCIRIHGTTTTSEVLDKIKALGFKFSTKAAITVAVCDAEIPPQKKEILAEADKKIEQITTEYEYGYISQQEKSKQFIQIWNQATDDVTTALKKNLDQYNPIFMMADSGARGSINQIRQLAGMRGLIANTSGATIEMPIRANYREGLNILEYFISSRGARKGLADTALRTADSGYLTRRLVDVSQDVIIREHDCHADDGIEVYEIRNGNEMIEPLAERLVGRYLVEDLRDDKGELIVSKNKLMNSADAKRVVESGVETIKIRSVLRCKAKQGVCAKCYGANLANGNLVNVGEAVGIIAAQSIGEPGTQLTMRTFHTGGIASAEDITQGLPRVEELFEGRRPKNAAIIARMSGRVQIEEVNKTRNVVLTNLETGESETYMIPYNFKIRVRPGQDIEKGEKLTEGNIYPTDILNILGPQAVQNYIIDEVQKVYRLQGVDINDKHIEVIVRQMLRKIKVEDSGSSYLLPGALVDSKEVAQINEELQERINNGEETLSLITTTPVLQGITKASSSSESFLSAASFQETTKALTDAAIRGKSDHLLGLKENVIIGKLVPAGTGMDIYNKVQVVKNEGYLEHAAAASNSATML
ncbi:MULTISPECIES: DNA-directed RNA polymerase subunit beta' [Ruminococcus]|uniref:DNA-directed RNA polymerase subunit beta' n=1 Tax=Ruminococcus TaxID=1263 RepID=UPI0002FCED0B|nr:MULTISPECIES: DNA-directed RNA polymerase subunit beta' [Ruminococcus]MED9892548.1 DNA-directed RNA polymerase subunit beta' [Ruminococcus champanellensis]CDD54099.1 dNA-directed RNA polymerase [Ruminococcus sp. CAG:379]